MVRDYKLDFPSDPEFHAFLDEFQRESDRAAAVLAAAFLDELLERLLRRSFTNEDKAVEVLFRWPGPLSSFAGKISVAYAVGLISTQERHDLDLMRDIRNDFGHELQGLSFGTRSIADRCRGFELNEERFAAQPDLGADYPREPRKRFDLAVALLAWYITRRISAAKRFASPYPPLWPQYDPPQIERASKDTV